MAGVRLIPAILIILIQTICAQTPVAKLFYSQEIPQAGDTLYLEVKMPHGWYINANRVTDEFLIPSSVEPIADGIEFSPALWPEPFEQYNEVLNVNLLLLRDSFTIDLPINSISQNYNPYDAKLKFTYQACSNVCLAPKTVEVSFNPNFIEASEKKNFNLNKKPLILYFLLAFIGGLLLNVMPCVLPILFLKIFDLIKKSGESRKNMLKWGFATASGIWSSFLVLALAIIAIRFAGNAVGWGFQFQHPAYTAAMALCIAIFAFSLWGVFEIWMPGNTLGIWERKAKAGGFRGAFAYGILLVLLSTPCSAPFLGTAVSFAFSASAAELLLIFTAIALGLSAPYLILSTFPQWTKILPKPGPWMETLKQFLGFPLLLTVVWLLWVFSRQTGAEASLTLMLLLCLAAFFAWLSGLVANPGKPWWRFVLLWLVFIAICALSWHQWIGPKISSEESLAEMNGKKIEWVPFSSKKLDSLQREGFAVWVNGTADWCITCKMNEKAVFETERVKEIFAEFPIVKMRADYTKPSDAALNFFELYGRSGVPFDLLLTSQGEAILLPELLTVEAVVRALEQAY